jgi:hypothetical protein
MSAGARGRPSRRRASALLLRTTVECVVWPEKDQCFQRLQLSVMMCACPSAKAGTHTRRPVIGTLRRTSYYNNERRWLWVPAFAGTTRGVYSPFDLYSALLTSLMRGSAASIRLR